jgi:hypothetical protein
MCRVVGIYSLTPHILSLSISIRCVISFTPQPHYTWKGAASIDWTGVLLGLTAGMNAVQKKLNLWTRIPWNAFG